MAFTLAPLPYAHDALEPYIDTLTMQIHHGKHHQAYVDNLNKAVAGTANENKTLEELVAVAGSISPAVRNNGGGHWNHTFFWESLKNPGVTDVVNAPSGKLADAINEVFVSFDAFKEKFATAGMTRFGSGWAWLIVKDGKLEISSTPNQDNPLMDVADIKGKPVLGVDVWEHAYYLKYQNKRADYLGAIWNVLDWGNVSKKYADALKSPLLKVIEKDAWKELKDFHQVMAQTFHPAEEGKFGPIRERSAEMLAKAKLLAANKAPSSFSSPEMKKAIATIVKGAEALNKLVCKEAADKKLMENLSKLHDDFHVIQGLCEH